jgi:hypothetical protein
LHSQWELKKRIELRQIDKNKASVIGYPKLDVINRQTSNKLFDNKNKTLLYNPHWDRRFSSFYKYGIEILQYFKNNPHFNLIFAPHSLIVERYPQILMKIKPFKKCPNIIIDLGSEQANDMTYTQYSDIYMGEFSSQALEFSLLKQRTCIFFNVAKIPKQDFPISWEMGKVYNHIDVNELEAVIEESEKLFKNKYSSIQIHIVNQTFTMSKEKSSSFLAAKAINKFISLDTRN